MTDKEKITELKAENRNLLDTMVRLGVENQLLKNGMTEMATASYNSIFKAGKYGNIGSNTSWWDCYAAYGDVGKIYGKFIIKKPQDKDSLLWGDAKI